MSSEVSVNSPGIRKVSPEEQQRNIVMTVSVCLSVCLSVREHIS